MASGIQLKPTDAANARFHVTAHAIGTERLFRDDQDKREFLARLRNYLDPREIRNSARRAYVKLHELVSLETFALLDTHFHLMLNQAAPDGMFQLMHRVQSSYGRYYNDRYHRRGPVFDGRYAAQPITEIAHARMCVAYIHLNHPIEQLEHPFTGHRLCMGEEQTDWIDSEAAIRYFGGVERCKSFLNREGPGIIERKLERAGLCRQTYRYRPID